MAPLGSSGTHQDSAKTNRFVDNVAPLQKDTLRKAVSFRTYDADIPPDVNIWVGRADELNLINEIPSGVIAITGIGGQGKSSLASQSLEQWRAANPGQFWDWRDCREEGERFPVQLASIIYRITLGAVDVHSLASGSGDAIARLFFRLVKDSQGLLVLDNVDHYVDVEQGTLSGPLKSFIHAALRSRTGFKIVLTCRPRVSFADLLFREIPLVGFSPEEAIMLFRSKGVRSQAASDVQILKMHRMTKGHPFWLTVLASEVERKKHVVDDLIRYLEAGHMEDNWILAMLRPVWKTLNDPERDIMLMLSECPKALSEDELDNMMIAKITSSSKIRKALRAVVAFGLVAKKSSLNQTPLYELHPLVRQYIRADLPPQESMSYSKLVADCTKKYIVRIIKDSTKTTLSIETFEFATVNIESLIRSGDRDQATKVALSVMDPFLAKGLIKEFVRLGGQILNCFKFDQIQGSDTPIHSLALRMLALYVEANQEPDARRLIQDYSPWMPTDAPFRIRWESEMCRLEWLLGNHDAAIAHGRKGVALKQQSGIDTKVDAGYMLHLALRDGGIVDEAQRYFLKGSSVEEALRATGDKAKHTASDFGNIGRCLYLKDDANSALQCYARSWDLLRREGTRTDIENQGWAGVWIGEALIAEKQFEKAAKFLAFARDQWSFQLPMKLPRVYELIVRLPDGVSVPDAAAALETADACDLASRTLMLKEITPTEIANLMPKEAQKIDPSQTIQN